MLNVTSPQGEWKLGVYGPSGTGKTHLGVTMPDPVILLSELHGFQTVRTASALMGKPTPPTFWIRNLPQLRRCCEILATSERPLEVMCMDPRVVPEKDLEKAMVTREQMVAELPYHTPKSVSLDSTTEIGDMVAAHVDRIGGLKIDEDGLPFRQRKAWGTIEEKMKDLLKTVRDLPYHVLFICLVNERNHGNEDNPDIRFEPLLPGKKLPKFICSLCNAFGIARLSKKKTSKDGERVLTRSVAFVAPDKFKQKVATPLRNTEVPDVSAWIEALTSGQALTGQQCVVLADEEGEDDGMMPAEQKAEGEEE